MNWSRRKREIPFPRIFSAEPFPFLFFYEKNIERGRREFNRLRIVTVIHQEGGNDVSIDESLPCFHNENRKEKKTWAGCAVRA